MIIRNFSLVLSVFALALGIVPAQAEWFEASSDHFVIYADDSEENVRIFAEKLERYHSAMERYTQRDLPSPSPSNRINVYALGSADAVRRLAGASGVTGFYLPRSQGSVAFVQDTETVEGRPTLSTKVLLHEYAHHFISSMDRFAMPLWMNEGAAEFFSSAYFHEDGSVYLGMPNSYRDFTIFWKEDEMTSVRELLDLDWERLKGRGAKAKQSFYGRSWILYHYLSTNEDRAGQLREYWLEVLKGTPSLDAARDVFGDLGVLERQLNMYFRTRGKRAFQVAADEISVSPVTLRALSVGEAEMMDVRVRSDRGLGADKAADLAKEARRIAADYPENAAVQSILAKVEFEARNDSAAIAAAQRAIAIDPDISSAHLSAGLAMFRAARASPDAEQKRAGYSRAMQALETLEALEADHIVPKIYAYRYYAEQKLKPTDSAKAALVRAAEMAPFDQELWLVTGMMHMNDGRIADARAALQPIASNPHGNEKAEEVRQFLTFLATIPEGQAVPVQSAISSYFITE
ncbi:hypothetical protein [Erythrobacter sp. MTPC3]|uniref:hypothetical protein n=1 Tax=Erythrobacter sp. MTPC3 TaxID=3056564 RepID=UPI0036F4019A